MHDTRFFTLVQSEGNHITGYITIPKHPKVSAAPVIVAFAPGFPARAHPVYDPQAHVLADMGFVVIRINQRGTEGFGRRFRDSLDGGIAKCAAEDALAAVNWAKSQTTLDTTRVALLGEDFAGFLALKALQLNPSAFRCAITFNAPIVPDSWLPDISDRNIGRQARRALLERSDPSIEELSLLKRNNPLLRPAFMVVHSVNNGAIAAESATLKSRLSKEGVPSTYREVHDDFALKLPLARARVYRELEEFLNLHLYDFNVKVGESKEVK
jgi:dipeptidyl aminopeptidase/acylaminoacyl peptidase